MTHIEELVRLDSEMKVVVKDQFSELGDLKKELEKNSEKVNKEKSDEKKLISKIKNKQKKSLHKVIVQLQCLLTN